MTREELIANWPAASANERFMNFFGWIVARLAGIDDLLPVLDIARTPGTQSVSQLGGASFAINPDFFTIDDPASALDAGDAIVRSLEILAMQELRKQQEARKKWEDEARKEQAKRWDKLTKDAKPKAKDPRAIYYELYVKPIEELEKGSG